MGIYQEYIGRNLNPQQLEAERKKCLRRIGEIRKSGVMTYAARMSTVPVLLPIGVIYDDLLPFADILAGVKGERISFILETPGGIGEIGRQMVEMLYERFDHVTFIVPGAAKSTGTIMVLGGHEIIMGPASALGPIDAQIIQEGKQFSADAFIEGLDRIKDEVTKTGKLNAAYIPILQKISPGEIQNALNALDFARETVTEWLVRHKFADWAIHSSTGKAVTEEEKRSRAYEIARELSSQGRWKTHNRSIRIADLRALRLKVTDFTDDPALSDAIQRYQVLLRMTFDGGNIFKIFETPDSQVANRFNLQVATPPSVPPMQGQGLSAIMEKRCDKCGTNVKVQLDFDRGVPTQPGVLRFPVGAKVACPTCGASVDFTLERAQAEKQVGRPAASPQPAK